MATFGVRRGSIPLYGVIDAATQEQFYAAFSDPKWAVWTLDLGEDALRLIADEFDEDLDGSAAELERYCVGSFRGKTKGLSGNRLGTVGEAISWMIFGGPSGRLRRVVGWKPARGPVVKGTRYVQPDFIEFVGDPTAVEVKSTEQLVFQRMALADKWQRLRACCGVSRCRDEALEQLGLAGSPLPDHRLVTRDGQIIPFPVGRGAAVALLARDGRIETYAADRRFRPPPHCRKAHPARNCWTCMSPSGRRCDVTVVRMDNAPGKLPLAGSGGERSEQWANAYGRWSHTLWARDEDALKSAAEELAGVTSSWLETIDATENDLVALKAFWGSYLCDAARQRGLLGAAAEPPLPTFESLVAEGGWRPADPEEPDARRTTSTGFLELAKAARKGKVGRFRLIPADDGTTIVLSFGEGICNARSLAPEAVRGAILTKDQAKKLAGKVAKTILVATGWITPDALSDPRLDVPLRSATVTLGDRDYELGWVGRIDPFSWRDSEEGYQQALEWWRHSRHRLSSRPPEPCWLWPFVWDSRFRVRVTRSGRCIVECSIAP